MLQLIDFFRKKYPEFVQLALSDIPNNEIVFTLDEQHYLTEFFHLLYEPQLIGIVLPEALRDSEDFGQIKSFRIPKNLQQQIDFEISFESTINISEKTILLFSIIRVNLHARLFERWYINRFFHRALIKNNYVISHFDAVVFDKMLSFFRYPKPVFVISTQLENANSFPVDTCRKVGNHYIFGVRASNKIMAAIEPGTQFTIGISDFSKKNLIYQLGKYGDAGNVVNYIPDTVTGIAVPEVVSGYERVVLEQIHAFETQSVFIAKIVSENIPLSESPFLAHLHKFWLLSKQARKYYL